MDENKRKQLEQAILQIEKRVRRKLTFFDYDFRVPLAGFFCKRNLQEVLTKLEKRKMLFFLRTLILICKILDEYK